MSEGYFIIRKPNQEIKYFELKQNNSQIKLFVESFEEDFSEEIYAHPSNSSIFKNITPTHAKKTNVDLKPSYQSVFQLAQDAFVSSRLKKVIIASTSFIDKKIDIEKSFLALCERFPSATIYVVSYKGENWLGASPELLFEKTKNDYKTIALAGTRKKSEPWTNKEKEEQNIVEYSMTKRLQTISSNLIIESVKDEMYGSLKHLKSTFYFSTNEAISKVKEILHPTAAIAGSPREIAKEFILKNEGISRGLYTGCIGLNEGEESYYFVGLRCAKLYTNGYEVYAGGGVTPESTEDMEWQEIQNKIQTFSEILTN